MVLRPWQQNYIIFQDGASARQRNISDYMREVNESRHLSVFHSHLEIYIKDIGYFYNVLHILEPDVEPNAGVLTILCNTSLTAVAITTGFYCSGYSFRMDRGNCCFRITR